MQRQHAAADERMRTGGPTLGIHMDYAALRIVQVHNGKITAWSSHPYPPGESTDSPGLPQVIEQALKPFAVRHRKQVCWLLGTLPSLQLRFLSVPKTRASQFSQMVYWTFRKEIPFDAAQSVFDYDVEGEQVAGSGRLVEVTACTVARAEIERRQQAFAQAGAPLAGIVIPHFAMRNLVRAQWINHAETALMLYVGDTASTIQILHHGRVVMSRVFITGMNAVLDALRERNPGWTAQEAYACMQDAEKDGHRPETEELVQAALARLMQQVERTIAAYLVGHGMEEIKCIHVLGPLAALPRLVAAMGAQWGLQALPAQVLERPHLGSRMVPPVDPGESALLTMAAATALASPHQTPNLLHTYVNRERRSATRRMRSRVAVLTALALVVVGGGHLVFSKTNAQKTRELARLKEQLAQYEPGVSRDHIRHLLQQAEIRQVQLRDTAHNSRTIALLNKLAALTPTEIRLASVRIQLAARGGGGAVPVDAQEFIEISGIVHGLPETQESQLASYVILLEDSALLSRVAIGKTQAARDGIEPVLLFEMKGHLERITELS